MKALSLSSLSIPVRIGLWRTRKSPLKTELARLTLPLFVETLLIMTLGAMDTFMLSRVGDTSVGAVGLANQVVTFCFMVFEVINLGTSVLCSQYLGARLQSRMETVVGVALTLNLAFGLMVSVGLWGFATPILAGMGLEGEALALGAGYMRVVGAFAFVQALGLTLSAVLRSNDMPVYPMMVILVVNALNILGNYALIFGELGMPRLGVVGAAWATAISRSIAMIALFVIVFRKVMSRFPVEIFRRFPMQEFRNLMRIGLPSAGETISYSCSQLVISYFIALLGMQALATRTYCVNMIMFVYLFCIAISHAGAILIGHLVGAARMQGAFILGKYIMKVAAISTASISLLLALAGPWLFGMLTSDPTVISLGTAILWIDVLLEVGRPVNIFFVNALQSAGDVNYPFYVGLIFMWSVAVVAAYIVGITFAFGLLGIWWMFCLDENLRAVVFIRRWYSLRWQSKSFVARQAAA